MFHFPRIFNFIFVSLILCALYVISVQNNTAQETPAEQPASAAPETVPAAETKTESPANSGGLSPADPLSVDQPSAGQASGGQVSGGKTSPVLDNAAPNPAAHDHAGHDHTAHDHADHDHAGHDHEAAAQDETAPVAEPVPFQKTGWFTLLILAVVLFGCYWLGNALAKQSRLPDHGFKIFIVLLAFFGSFAALALGWHRLTLGIDLQGGVVLIYDAKPIRRGGTAQDTNAAAGGLDMDQLTRAISKRINPGGVREIAITKLGTQQVQVVIPHAEDAEVARIERVISESGALTFRILASRAYEKDADIIKRGEAESGRDVLDSAGRVIARWVPVFDSQKSEFTHNPDYVSRQRGSTKNKEGGILEILVKFDDDANVTGEYLTYTGRGNGENGGPGVSFHFDAVGQNKFGRLTSANRPDPVQARLIRHLGIILNDNLYSAPVIRNTIRDAGIIEFSAGNTEEQRRQINQDIDDLISILDAGALPAELSKEPAGRMLIGATLGNDTIQKAKYALTASAVATVIFMICYYGLAGCIASFCVITNTALIIAVMLALRAAFTLPGLAGLVLTIGMAVDANILIYERIREELAGGASLKMAIRNGYGKAFSAIFDSNITTIIVGCILYAVGTEQVKGFAVTLVLGIALNMFTAIFCARVIMEVLAAQRWCKTFKMMQLFKRPNINFLGARIPFVVFSAVLIVIGLAAVIARGRSLLDIDFVGGVSVEVVFNDSQDISEVRSKLYAKDATITGKENKLNDLSVQNVGMNIGDEGQKIEQNTHFMITTSIPQVKGQEILPDAYLETVRHILKETFGNDLEYCKLDCKIEKSEKVADYDETTVSITRYPKTNYESLVSEIRAKVKKAVQDKKIDSEFSDPVITRQGFIEGSQTAYEDWTLTFRASKENLEKVLAVWKAELDGTPNFPTSTTVGGSVASNTRIQGTAAIIASLIFIIIYISIRFHRLVYGLIAVAGLLHDVLIMLGLLALSGWITVPFLQIEEFKIGLPVVAAFLTIIGYSINDTIVLFDRIRENLGKSSTLTGSMINTAINQTLSRTVLTSLTTFVVALILYFFGGQGIHTFAFAISLGVFFGTYSTIGICSSFLYWAIGVNDLSGKKPEKEKK
ncbi:MAG: protein translocase subunit SecD [Planctomycetaceae bacterium]|jgi:SecD/SecF fusion protein|nr:protein translocase subunit SecD [Planctomycetaceae bacterium]